MLAKFLYHMSSDLPCRVIHIDGKPYLERYAIGKLLGFTFYLHRFITGDDERKIHNHPWAHSLAIVLTGGYTEERMQYLDVHKGPVCKLISRHWRPINYISGAAFHRILNPKPETWTLFIHSKRRQAWGFYEHLPNHTDPIKNITVFHQPLQIEENHGWAKTATIAALNSERTAFNSNRESS